MAEAKAGRATEEEYFLVVGGGVQLPDRLMAPAWGLKQEGAG